MSEITGPCAALLEALWREAPALPAAVAARTRRLWLDTAACATSGLAAPEVQPWLAAQAAGDAGVVPLPGRSHRLGASAATMALALGACWDEACEGLAAAHGRPGVPIVAALWPQLAAAASPPSWHRVWQATAVGYEAAARLGARLRIRAGLHVDGTWAAFGAAVALVHLRGGSAAQALAAIEAAAVQMPFTLVLAARAGANVRNLYLAHSAWLGRQAALAIDAGFAAPRGALDEACALMLDGATAGTWIEPGRWLILDSYWKAHAAVRHVHYGAEAALAWHALGRASEAIESIELEAYPEALQYCANRAPVTPLAAQFSLSFGVAAGLRFGALSPAEVRAPRFADAELRRLEALVRVRADAARWPAPARGARLVVHERGGERWERTIDRVPGDPGAEPDAAAIARKFEHYTAGDTTLARWAATLDAAGGDSPAALPATSTQTST